MQVKLKTEIIQNGFPGWLFSLGSLAHFFWCVNLWIIIQDNWISVSVMIGKFYWIWWTHSSPVLLLYFYWKKKYAQFKMRTYENLKWKKKKNFNILGIGILFGKLQQQFSSKKMTFISVTTKSCCINFS